MRERGTTYREIAERMNADGIPTLQGAVGWQPHTVRSVILTRLRVLEAQRQR